MSSQPGEVSPKSSCSDWTAKQHAARAASSTSNDTGSGMRAAGSSSSSSCVGLRRISRLTWSP
eukprot:7966116-Alexandrium_andersonii.AAC.1